MIRSLALVIIIVIAVSCRGDNAADRARATAALLSQDDLGPAWSISIVPRIDNDTSGPKGIDAICPYDAASESRFFVLTATDTHMMQVVYVMDPSRAGPCIDQLRANPIYNDRSMRPDLLPAECPETSFAFGPRPPGNASDEVRAFVPGARGLLSVLLYSGALRLNPGLPSSARRAPG